MSLTKFLDPKNDVAFKKIFGTEKNKDILIHFLNDMIVFKEKKPITDVSFLKTVQDPDISSKKTSIVDILCTDQDNHTYVVEMQVASHKGFEKRAQYYAAKAYCNQMKEGEKYQNLKEVIFVAIANFTMFPDKEAYKSDHVILDKDTYENNLKDFSFTFLELEKFKKMKDELWSMIDKWAYFFKHASETTPDELQAVIGQDTIIQRAYAELDRFYWSEEELMTYEKEVKRVMDNQAVLDEQLSQAEIKGIQKGMEKGMEKGKAEEKTEIAINLLNLDLSLEKISKATGLSMSVLEDLKKSEMSK